MVLANQSNSGFAFNCLRDDVQLQLHVNASKSVVRYGPENLQKPPSWNEEGNHAYCMLTRVVIPSKLYKQQVAREQYPLQNIPIPSSRPTLPFVASLSVFDCSHALVNCAEQLRKILFLQTMAVGDNPRSAGPLSLLKGGKECKDTRKRLADDRINAFVAESPADGNRNAMLLYPVVDHTQHRAADIDDQLLNIMAVLKMDSKT
ncbi:hypothetical protein BX600DRAFT_448652 [Xylariales sp. PMI_506]|nr:hypothetical protein BX600DRAFT_448652 [Xylariales sp. PMI_506]